jgi:hypothetical protein
MLVPELSVIWGTSFVMRLFFHSRPVLSPDPAAA